MTDPQARPVLRLKSPRTIWVVWRPDSKKVRRRHDTEESAQREADRLASKYPGKLFFVMRSVRAVRRPTLGAA